MSVPTKSAGAKTYLYDPSFSQLIKYCVGSSVAPFRISDLLQSSEANRSAKSPDASRDWIGGTSNSGATEIVGVGVGVAGVWEGVALGAGDAVEEASVAVGVGDAEGCGEPKSMATTGRKFNCAVVFN